jgi:hypothetical protein
MTNKMQRSIILFIIVNALHVSSDFPAHHQELISAHTASSICQTCLLLPLGFSAHHQELKTVHAISGICQTCLLLPLAVTANKFDKYLMPHVQISAPDDERKNRSKHVEG